uniref:Uncharacterized protein n=1 Tax=Arundo donax TaxID=35708 RepID=A0A0A9GKJ8_ARUDO
MTAGHALLRCAYAWLATKSPILFEELINAMQASLSWLQ